MKLKLLLFLLIAGAVPVAAAPLPVRYAGSAPPALLRRVPPGGASRFFGRARLRGRTTLFHVYDTAPPDLSKYRADYGANDYAPNERAFQALPLHGDFYNVQRCRLDLFARERQGRLRRLNSVPFHYVRFINPHFRTKDTVGVDILWLDPATRRVPIVKVDLRDPEGVEGPVGVQMLVVFSNGLTGQAVAEGFGYGADNSSDRNSWGSSFTSRDARGLLEVRSLHATRGSKTHTVLQWNQNYFRAIRSRTQANNF